MSVYCSFAVFDGEDSGYPAPRAYRGSHVLPSADDSREGCDFDLGYVPGFITRDGRDDGPEDPQTCWPFLRVALTGSPEQPGTVVMDAGQVATLVEALRWWLARVCSDGV